MRAKVAGRPEPPGFFDHDLDVSRKEVPMRKALFLAAAIALACSAAIDARAQDTGTETATAEVTKPINLALWNPIQIYDENMSIKGVRLNILWGKNKNVTGLDIGIANGASGVFKGVQWGAVLNIAGEMYGWQTSFFNISEGTTKGLQGPRAIYNQMEEGTAVQIGLVNKAESIKGFQLGVMNITNNLHGLQIALLNVVLGREKWKYLPIVSWSF